MFYYSIYEQQSLAEAACTRLHTLKPEPLTSVSSLKRISTCNYTDHLERIKECDWVIEAVAESMDIKQQVYQLICPVLAPHALITTNTSGLSIQTLAKALPDSASNPVFLAHTFLTHRAIYLLLNVSSTLAQIIRRLINSTTLSQIGLGKRC